VTPLSGREAAEALDEPLHLEQRGAKLSASQAPYQAQDPSGARTTKATSTTPTMNRFISDEIVTVASCWAVPSRTAPITGPTQLVVPPIIGMASAFTAVVEGEGGVGLDEGSRSRERRAGRRRAGSR
jgi:hypothetical protein